MPPLKCGDSCGHRESSKPNDVDPQAWLADLYARIADISIEDEPL